MFSGTLYYAQEIFHSEETDLRDAVLAVKKEHKEDEDEDSAELLEVRDDGEIYYLEHTGAVMKSGDYGAVGHGSTMGLALLDMIYQPNRSEKWLKHHLENIMRIVEKYDVTVFRPSRFERIDFAK